MGVLYKELTQVISITKRKRDNASLINFYEEEFHFAELSSYPVNRTGKQKNVVSAFVWSDLLSSSATRKCHSNSTRRKVSGQEYATSVISSRSRSVTAATKLWKQSRFDSSQGG